VTKTLLVVDDSATMRKVFELTLLGEDVTLVTHDGGDSLLARARDARPAAAIVDVQLGSQNGYDVCRALKSDPVLGAIPVVLLFSDQNPLDAAKMAECGAESSISKPFETQTMIDRVKQLLSESQMQLAPPSTPQPRPTTAITGAGPALSPSGVPVSSAGRTGSAPPTGGHAALRATHTLGTAVAPTPPPAPSLPMPPVARPATGEARALGTQEGDTRAGAMGPAVIQPSSPRATASTSPLSRTVATPVPRTTPAPTPAVSASQQRPAIVLPADLEARAAALGLTPAQVEAVAALTREVVERVVWEVVPPLAETMIREEIRRLTAD
jgi:CheY-like chemotaxis protein